jgi:hypothetical protein
MSDLLLAKRGVHPQVAALARDIKDAQLAEITPWTVGSRLWAVISLRGHTSRRPGRHAGWEWDAAIRLGEFSW